MARPIPRGAFGGPVPATAGGLALTEVELGPVTSVAPFRGQAAAVTAVLSDALGLAFPDAGQNVTQGAARILWVGRGRALLCGVAAPTALAGLAALTDQTGAQAVLRVEGADALAVLARLVPVDLRVPGFPQGRTARTMLGHMAAGVTRTGPQSFEVMVMRSMAGSLLHDIDTAARGVAARAALG